MKKLIGKTIKNVEVVGDYDLYGDGDRVTEVTKITCADNTEVYLLGDGGDGDFYCTFYTSIYNPVTKRFSRDGTTRGEFGQWCD